MTPMEKALRRANVVYDLDSFETGAPHVPPFVSNGILGGCFDLHGFMSRPNTGIPEGRTVLGYIDHYHRQKHGRHIQFSLAVIQAAFADGSEPGLVDCHDYRQELDIATGILTTQYDLHGPTKITAFASQQMPELFVMRVERKPVTPEKALAISVECETSVCQNNDAKSSLVDPVAVSFEAGPGRILVRSKTNVVETEWVLAFDGGVIETAGTKIILRMTEPAGVIRIFVRRPGGAPCEAALARPFDDLQSAHAKIWRTYWKTSHADFPEDRAQRIWVRSAYYAGCNFPLTPARPMCPTGILSNIWGFYFPQDVYYVAENVPRLGHFQRALAAMEYWLEHLPDARDYCERLMGVTGAYYPWTPPYRDWADYEKDGVTSPDSYELHNPAYVAAIVWHYFLYAQDTKTLARFFPLIEEVFRFYRNISAKNPEGAFDIYHENARGQDEASSTDGRLKNLLCASWSAEFTARAYVQASEITGHGEPGLLEIARDMLRSGLNRKPLLRPDGIYATYEGDDRPPGSQKHPVQLNPIAFLPMPDLAEDDSPAVRAWQQRYDLTQRARRPLSLGWTLGEFALASARMRAPAELEKDLRAIQPCRMADPRWIQFYESSYQEGWHLSKAYYFTTSGLYLQAFTDTLLQDWRGYADLFACLLPGWETKRFSFAGWRVRGGAAISATWNRGRFKVVIRPKKAESIRVRISRPDITVTATGQASGPAEFPGNTIVEFTFNGRKPITLASNKNYRQISFTKTPPCESF